VTQAFSLALQEHGIATLEFDLPDKSVNIFNEDVLAELSDLVAKFSDRRDIKCLVLLSAKSDNFIAGADLDLISGITDPSVAEAGVRFGQQLFQGWEDLPFPTIAAIRGTCVGGGTELALASTHILISDRPEIRIGLPEVRLGIIPAWGGCTRLPRRVGIQAALDMILAGKTIPARKAFKIGLVDGLLPDASFHELVWQFAEKVSNSSRSSRRPKKRLTTVLLEENALGRRILFDQARKQVLKKSGGHYPAPLRALEVVRTGVEQGLGEGFMAESRAEAELIVSPLTKNLLHVFRLIESSKRDVGGTAESAESLPKPRTIRQAAVIGAGAMGGGIAHLFADRADIPVRLKEIGLEPLAKGLGHAAKLLQSQVKRRRLSSPEAKRKLSLIRPTLDYSGLERTDLVVEAVIEDLGIKQKVLAEVGSRLVPDAVLASNTSSIRIDSISENLENPSRVVGLHFFNPVHKMPLVEIVAGSQTSPKHRSL
jgi:3-hydroxyacyl-CoA dehydrogenase/enoyl-CoA hydratase/3-hydroxybutyryl-CoA epimerase